MIITHKSGMRYNVSVSDHQQMLFKSRFNANLSHARRTARKIYRTVIDRVKAGGSAMIEAHPETLAQLARKHQVKQECIAYCVEIATQLLPRCEQPVA